MKTRILAALVAAFFSPLVLAADAARPAYVPPPAAAVSSGSVLQVILPFFGLFVALLMVSRIRYPHVTNRVLRGQRSFGHVVALIFTLVLVQSIGNLYLPTLNADIINNGVAKGDPSQRSRPLSEGVP